MDGRDCDGDITTDVTRYILLDIDASSSSSQAVRVRE